MEGGEEGRRGGGEGTKEEGRKVGGGTGRQEGPVTAIMLTATQVPKYGSLKMVHGLSVILVSF